MGDLDYQVKPRTHLGLRLTSQEDIIILSNDVVSPLRAASQGQGQL